VKRKRNWRRGGRSEEGVRMIKEEGRGGGGTRRARSGERRGRRAIPPLGPRTRAETTFTISTPTLG
jgi:hypothetical protein